MGDVAALKPPFIDQSHAQMSAVEPRRILYQVDSCLLGDFDDCDGVVFHRGDGVYKGRKQLLTPVRAAELTRRLGLGESKAALAREFKLDRTTVYRYIGRAKPEPGCAGK